MRYVEKKTYFVILLGFLIGGISPLKAWNISNVFDLVSSNTTAPSSFRDSMAGYYTGGGVSLRGQNRRTSPISFTPPSVRTGCGGIDIFWGSLGMIGKDDLVRMIQKLGSSMAVYGAHLALSTLSPQVETIIKDLRNLAMKLNAFSIDNCESVRSLFAVGLPKNTALHETVCREIQQSGGEDYLGARSRCQDYNNARAQVLNAQNNPQSPIQDLLIDNVNIFEKAATRAGVPANMKKDLMSMAGTVVIVGGKTKVFESLIKDEHTFDHYIQGGSVSMYRCEDASCLNILEDKDVILNPDKSYKALVKEKLQKLKNKMKHNTPFDQNDIRFFNGLAGFPLYQAISLEAVSGLQVLDPSSDWVARALVIYYLESTLTSLKASLRILEAHQYDRDAFDVYLENLTQVIERLHQKNTHLYQRSVEMEQRIRLLEAHHMAPVL